TSTALEVSGSPRRRRRTGGFIMTPGVSWETMRSFSRDSSVTRQRLSTGLGRRIVRYARPYARDIVPFLLLVAASAVLGVVNPLLFKAIIDDGILPRHLGVVVWASV